MKINPLLYLRGFIVAITIYSAFNHFPGTPILTTIGTLLILSPILWLVFQKSIGKTGCLAMSPFFTDDP